MWSRPQLDNEDLEVQQEKAIASKVVSIFT